MPIPSPEVLVTRLDPVSPLPSYAHPGDAGAELAPGKRACGVTLVNSPDTIDAGYRGEIKPIVVDRLPDSARGSGGHGSTGGHALLLDRTI